MNIPLFKNEAGQSLAPSLAGISMAPLVHALDVEVDLVLLRENGRRMVEVPRFRCGLTADMAKACNALPGWALESLIANTADTLSINLRNCLSEPVSIVIPGQTA
ncbi:MAG: hypothetical protein R3E95_05520 [Thiolinea sp.]